jgi:DNA-binding transcriptional ArsR family regulator
MRARQRKPGRPPLRAAVKLTKDKIEPLLGLSADEIAKRLKVSYSTLCRHLERLWPGSNGRVTDIRGHLYKGKNTATVLEEDSKGRCCPMCHRSWEPKKTREQRLEERLDIIENELASCKYPPAWVPEQLSLFPVGFRDELRMKTLAKELAEIPRVKDSIPVILPVPKKVIIKRAMTPKRKPVISGTRSSFAWLDYERPRLAAPIRIMTAEELARL